MMMPVAREEDCGSRPKMRGLGRLEELVRRFDVPRTLVEDLDLCLVEIPKVRIVAVSLGLANPNLEKETCSRILKIQPVFKCLFRVSEALLKQLHPLRSLVNRKLFVDARPNDEGVDPLF